MAAPHPSPDGDDRRRRKGRLIRTTFNVVGIGALLAASIAAVALWLLLKDPVLAGEVAERESLLPVVRTLVVMIGKAISAVIAYL